MRSDTPSPPPHRLDREAVERVLRRAAALQAEAGGQTSPLLDETAVYEAAAEVGLRPGLVRQALLEERVTARATPETGFRVRLAGPGTVAVSRTVEGDGAATLSALGYWMHHQESLQPRRRRVDEVVWEPREDWGARLQRAVPFDGRRYVLARARQVVGTVADDGHGRVCIRLTADLRHERLRKLASGGAITGAGTLGAIVGALAEVPIPADVLIAATGAGVGAAVSRTHAAFAASATDALERILDRVESGGEARPSTLAAAVSRGLTTGMEHIRRVGDLHRR